VIERTGVACAASGKSGGFLALDWCDGSPLAPLARRSFALHAELAAKFAAGGAAAASFIERRRRRPAGPGHIGAARAPGLDLARGRLRRRLGTTATTAQVGPTAFTRRMMEAAHSA